MLLIQCNPNSLMSDGNPARKRVDDSCTLLTQRVTKTKARKSSGIEEPESSRSSAMTATLTVLQNLL